MQVASSLRGDRMRSSTAAAATMRASRPLRISRLVVVGMLAGLEGVTVPVMGIAAHELLASHQLPSEAWAMGTGVIHATLILLGTIAFLLSVRMFGGYREDTADDLAISLARMLTGGAVASVSLAALVYATIDDSWSHWSWFWTWLATASAALIGMRIAHFVMVNRLTQAGAFTRDVVIFGVGEIGQQMLSHYFAEPLQDVRVIGVFDDRGVRSPDYCCGYEVRGNIDNLLEFARAHVVDEVIVALPPAAEVRLATVLGRLREIPVDVPVAVPTIA